MDVVPNLVYIPLWAYCTNNFQGRERNQDYFVAVLCCIRLQHRNIKDHLGVDLELLSYAYLKFYH